MRKIMTMDELPDIILAQDIADHMRIERNTVYELMKKPVEHGGIPNFKIGKSRRVWKVEYERWISNQHEAQGQVAQRRMHLIEGGRKHG